MTLRRRAMVATALLCLAAAGPDAADQAPNARVLFIGNSLTFTNNLPAMVAALNAQPGLKGRIRAQVGS